MSQNKHPKKSQPSDWHPADIIAALRKTGWSLRALSVKHGLNPGTLKKVMQVPYPKAERHVADALSVKPWVIWPSRYDTTVDENGVEIGVPNRNGKPGRKRGKIYDTPAKKSCNVKNSKAA